MKGYFLLTHIFLYLLPSAVIKAADTLSVLQKAGEELRCSFLPENQLWENRAIYFDRRSYSLTGIDISGRYEERGRAAIAQEGNRQKMISPSVYSFIKLDENSRLFGYASYQNSQRDHVLWNENSDFTLLYPYVTGDSIGGFLKEETYRFAGGYAHRLKGWTAAAEISYRASNTYRDKDPRPQNIVSDLHIQLAVSRAITEKDKLGIAVKVRKYHQKSDIVFLSDKGNNPVYQMLGLGMDYVRFAGTLTSFNYRGNGWGGSLDYIHGKDIPMQTVWSLSLSGNRLHLIKESGNLNAAPLTELKLTELSMEGSWNYRNHSMAWGMQLQADLQLRTGIENIFGDPGNNEYPIINRISPFESQQVSLSWYGSVGNAHSSGKKWGWNVSPLIRWQYMKPQYKKNNRYIQLDQSSFGASETVYRIQSRWLLTATTEAYYTRNLTSKSQLTGISTQSSVGRTLISNLKYLSENHTTIGVHLKGLYRVNQQSAVYIECQWKHQKYEVCGNTDLLQLNVGCLF